jgi:SAM-dependent methyltransferase
MSDDVQTWHYGLVARHWAEHNTGGPEIAFFQQQIETYGQPALDAGCGTGRLLLPFLRAGLDVDGCDVSGDMLDYCRQAAEREGLSPHLYQQAFHQLNLPHSYRTIFTCGVFGIGVSRAQDFLALQRFYEHLEPGGVLLLEHELPYEDEKVWPLWRKDARVHLPEQWPSSIGTPPAAGEQEYQLHYRLLSVDPLEQHIVGEMRTLLFKDNEVVVDQTYTLAANLYFHHEMRMLLAQAGFHIEAEKADLTEAAASADSDAITYVARK